MISPPEGPYVSLHPVEDPVNGSYTAISGKVLSEFPALQEAIGRVEERGGDLTIDTSSSEVAMVRERFGQDATIRVNGELYRVQAISGVALRRVNGSDGAAPLPEGINPELHRTIVDRLVSASTDTKVVILATDDYGDQLERMMRYNGTFATNGISFRAEPFSKLYIDHIRFRPGVIDLAKAGPEYTFLRVAVEQCISESTTSACTMEISEQTRILIERLLREANASTVKYGDRYVEVRISMN